MIHDARTRISKRLGDLLVVAVVSLLCFAAPAAAQNLTVFAAASLKDALDEIVHGYAPNAKIVVSYAASSTLAKQIENAAPADLFISADLDWMDYLETRKLIDSGSRINLLRNRLVIIAPADSRATLAIKPGFGLAEALGNGRLAMANPDSVPAGKYGKAALQSLGVWQTIAAKVAPAANVRAALALVSRGEAPFGVVYKTDAIVDNKVKIVGEFPDGSHPPIVYPAAVVAASKNPQAQVFLDHLGSAFARAVFAKYGF